MFGGKIKNYAKLHYSFAFCMIFLYNISNYNIYVRTRVRISRFDTWFYSSRVNFGVKKVNPQKTRLSTTFQRFYTQFINSVFCR